LRHKGRKTCFYSVWQNWGLPGNSRAGLFAIWELVFLCFGDSVFQY